MICISHVTHDFELVIMEKLIVLSPYDSINCILLNITADYSHSAVLTPHRFLFCLEISTFKLQGTRDAAEDASPW